MKKQSNDIRTGTTTDLDNYFYGKFAPYERDSETKKMMVTIDKVKVPVEDWRFGREMSGAKIMELADHFYKLGQSRK